MIEENRNQLCSPTLNSRLYYSQATNLIENESQLLLAFLKQLTFQSFLLPQPSLSFEEVQKLKIIIDRLHTLARNHKITLKQIQGVWPLLSIIFVPMNGLQLYLQFQKLLMPPAVLQVKQQQGYFSPNGYFQENNDWKNDKNIMTALRTLEKNFAKRNYQNNKQDIFRLYEFIAVDKAQYLIISRDFQNRLDRFRKNTAEANKIQWRSKLTTMLSDSFFGIKGPTSQPDLLTNTLKMFSLKEIEDIHETKTNKIVPILEEEIEEEYQASPSKQQQTMSPFKRKLRIGCSDTTKLPRQRNSRNNTRFYYAKKFFQLQKRQNIVFAEMKAKKIQLIHEKNRRNKLQKITSRSRKVNNYLSDEEDVNKKTRRNQASSCRKKQKDGYIFDYDSEVFSQSEQMLLEEQFEDELSEEPVIRRNSKFLKRAPAINPGFEMDIEEDYPIQAEKYSWKGGNNLSTFKENHQQQYKGKYQKGSIKKKQAEEMRKTEQKIDNIQVRLLITEGGEGFNSDFDFLRYRRYLETLQGKEITKQACKIILEVIDRDTIAFDKKLLLKVITFFQLSIEKQKNNSVWKSMREFKIKLALKYMITSNMYRGYCEVINCFFDRNEDEVALHQARQYFNILSGYVDAYKLVGIQQEITQIIFEALLTPKKYNQFKNYNRFSSQNEQVQFGSPLLTAKKSLKYNFTQHQELIAFLIGQFTFISLTLEKFFYEYSCSQQKQKQYFAQLHNELTQMKDSASTNIPFPFKTITILMKNFYLLYRPRLNDIYLKGLINFFHLSFNQHQIQSITEKDAEEEAKQLIHLVTSVFQDFIQKEFSKTPPAIGANVYSRLMKTQTKLKKTYEGKKQSNVALLFSTIFSLLLKWPQFRVANMAKQLMSTFQSTVLDGPQKNITALKPALYSPILNCIYDLYNYKVELFQHTQHLKTTEQSQYKPLRKVILTVWEKLLDNYNNCYKDLQLTIKQKGYKFQNRGKIEFVIQKLKNCEQGFILFLTLFILDGATDRPNFVKQSFSHRNFCLQFILKQHYFFKFFQDATNHSQYVSKKFISCFVDVHHRWFSFFPSIDFFFKQYSSMILEHKQKYEQKRALQFLLISQVEQPNIQQSFANIYATQLILVLIEASQKGKSINLMDNLVFKLIDQNNDPNHTSFIKISKNIQIFYYFIVRIIRFFEVEQLYLGFLDEKVKQKVKKVIYDFLKEKFLKKITILIILASLIKNNNKYQGIPLKQLVQNLKKLRLFQQKSTIDQRIPFQCQLFFKEGIEKIQSFTDIQEIFSQIIKWRKNNVNQQQNKRALRGFESLLQQSYSCMKKLSFERQKQAVPIQWMKWITFAMKWPQIINRQRLFKERCAFSQLKITTYNMKVFLKLLQAVNSRTENMYKIKEIDQILVENICRNPSQREQELCKQVKLTLMCLRHCLQSQQTLVNVGNQFVQKLLKAFCSPQRLIMSNNVRERLTIYFEMMEGSEQERPVYESLIIKNSKQFMPLIHRYMKGYIDKKGQLCQTIESLIISCMIRKHSQLLDVKRLLTTFKNSNSVLCSSMKAIYSLLFRRLQLQAQESQIWGQVNWCKDQINQIQSDSLADWMDIQ